MATCVWRARDEARFDLCSGLLTLVCLVLLSVSFPEHGAAQNTSEKAAAEALFDRGLALMKDGKYQEACERLEQSQAVERGIGTMLYLAECYEKIGKTASAWALFREAASSAQAAGQSERAEAGRRRAEKLEKGLSRLTVHVPPANRLPGMVVQDNGSPLQAAVWGVALPVDPGLHRVEVSAPGYTSWSSEVKVDDRGASAETHVPALVKDPNAAVAIAPTPAETANQSSAGAGPANASEAAREPAGMSTMRIVGISLGAAGVAGIVAGAIAGGLAMKNTNEYKDYQEQNGQACNATCAANSEDADLQGKVSTAMWAVGGALLATGLVTFFLAPKHEKGKADVAFSVDPRGAALRVGGVF
jgi:tetratricopeptide (TPR) repeat protein